ncbi:MAG: class I SAM-dependent methyltransferase [Candidatus ainarchaeum sp.]|nr:class I SAM-dependent methyltransferase [Candidatus ainarchaeum sp.]
MAKTKTIVTKKILDSNEWYVGDQTAYLEKGHYKHHHEKRVEYLLSIINRFCKGLSKIKILDIGCGDGAMTKHLLKINNAIITGIDYNPIRVKRAKKLVKNVDFFHRDAFNPGFQKESFDVILLHHMLEHIPDDVGLLQSMNKLLKKEGILIVGVPNEGNLICKFRNNIVQPKILKNTDHVHFYTKKSFYQLAKTAGFKVVEDKGIGFIVPHTKVHAALSHFKITYNCLYMLGKIFQGNSDSLFFVLKKSRY